MRKKITQKLVCMSRITMAKKRIKKKMKFIPKDDITLLAKVLEDGKPIVKIRAKFDKGLEELNILESDILQLRDHKKNKEMELR